jgi:hypothetical protein
LAGVGVAVAVGLAVAGWLPTRSLAGETGVGAMLAGLAAALVGAWAGLGVSIRVLRVAPRDQVNFILGGLGVRFAITVAAAIALAFSGLDAPKTAVLWVAVGHLPILAADTTLLSAMLKRGGRPMP